MWEGADIIPPPDPIIGYFKRRQIKIDQGTKLTISGSAIGGAKVVEKF